MKPGMWLLSLRSTFIYLIPGRWAMESVCVCVCVCVRELGCHVDGDSAALHK
jgi:hypothetical protein